MRNAAFIAAALFAGCGILSPGYPQFNQSAYRIEGLTTPAEGGAAARTVIYRDGARMRVETVLAGLGPSTIVFDEATNAAYVLNPKSSPLTPPGQLAAPPPETSTAPPTPAPQGVAVRVEDTDAPQPLETAWDALGEENARSVGRCEVAGERGHQWRPREEPAGVERVACITDDGIVLRVSENGRVLWEATSLQRGAQDAALFGVPAGYQMIDPRHTADRASQRIDDVVGAPPRPQEAPPPRG